MTNVPRVAFSGDLSVSQEDTRRRMSLSPSSWHRTALGGSAADVELGGHHPDPTQVSTGDHLGSPPGTCRDSG